MKLTLKLKTFQETELIRDIENDFKNDNDIIKVDDLLRDNDCT